LTKGPWLSIRRDEPAQYRLRMESALGTLPVIICANLALKSQRGAGQLALARFSEDFLLCIYGQKGAFAHAVYAPE
jgi:hypothetical protein